MLHHAQNPRHSTSEDQVTNRPTAVAVAARATSAGARRVVRTLRAVANRAESTASSLSRVPARPR